MSDSAPCNIIIIIIIVAQQPNSGLVRLIIEASR
jgi:hypothetical protein